MDISKIKKQIDKYDKNRRKILNYLMKPRDMIKGSLYEMKRVCGNLNCKCNKKGEKHISKYISQSVKGETKLKYVKKKDEFKVTAQTGNYKNYQKKLAEVRKINDEIFEQLKKIRDSKIKEYK